MSKIRVAVLMGGKSTEREVSLSTGGMILTSLDPEKYDAFPVDTADFGRESLSFPTADVAFIALHGRFGEDGTVQGLLELLGIPYVGSGVLASALAMDKIMARRMMQLAEIPIPRGIEVREGANAAEVADRIGRELGYPAVVKPNRQGSTIGLSIVRDASEVSGALDLAFEYDADVLIEEFIEGTEITGAVIGNDDLQVLPLVEIVPEGGFYDYHAKYTPGATEEIVPARIPTKQYQVAEEIAKRCHQILGCRGMSRTDMMVRGDEVLVLELNTIPGMTPTSLLPRAARAAGIEFPDLLDKLIRLALEKR